jgi:hypothetical protein
MVKRLKKSDVLDALAAVGAELFFALLPLLVLTLVLIAKHRPLPEIMASPEWSFGSAILVGQTLVKFVSGLTRAKRIRGARVGFVVAAFFVCGVVPALAILILVALADHHAPAWMIWTQLGIFAVSMIVFLLLGGIGHIWTEESRAMAETA